MSNGGRVTLKQRAVRAWRKERPKRIAQLTKRAQSALELCNKLEEVLGDGLPINIAADLRGRPVATVEGLRFSLTDMCEKSGKKLLLLDVCTRCETETGLIINSLADLGQLFEGLGPQISLGCTKCIGLADEDLPPKFVMNRPKGKTRRNVRRERRTG
jgi:hypothetical protein